MSEKRRNITTKMRAEIFERHKGICHYCNMKVMPPGDSWDVSHVIPLGIGGADDETNWAVIHTNPCHRLLTATVDIPRIAKTKRQAQKNIGAKAPSKSPLPGGKKSPWKRKIGGGVVPR